MEFLTVFALAYVIWPFYLSSMCRKKLLASWTSKPIIVYVAAVYVVFAAILPTLMVYGAGLKTDFWGGRPISSLGILCAFTAALRLYDIVYYQLALIARDSWNGQNDKSKYPYRAFFGHKK